MVSEISETFSGMVSEISETEKKMPLNGFRIFWSHFAGIVQNIYQTFTVEMVSENSETISDYVGLIGSVNFWNHFTIWIKWFRKFLKPFEKKMALEISEISTKIIWENSPLREWLRIITLYNYNFAS